MAAKRKVKKKESEFVCHASQAGKLMMDKRGAIITPKQLKQLETLQFRQEQSKLDPKKALTAKMVSDMDYLIAKRDAPIVLSDTAKDMINRVWVFNKKGIPDLVTSKYMEKGKWAEQDGIELLTEVDGQFYVKNTERINNGMFTGECDINSLIPGVGKVIQDVKCCWSAITFINSALDIIYEWQGRVYMELYDADEFWLRYCLVDTPDHIADAERYRFASVNGIIDEATDEATQLMDFFDKTLFFSNNEKLDLDERVKTYKIKRDKKEFQKIVERIPIAREYYESIKLNQLIIKDAA